MLYRDRVTDLKTHAQSVTAQTRRFTQSKPILKRITPYGRAKPFRPRRAGRAGKLSGPPEAQEGAAELDGLAAAAGAEAPAAADNKNRRASTPGDVLLVAVAIDELPRQWASVVRPGGG